MQENREMRTKILIN